MCSFNYTGENNITGKMRLQFGINRKEKPSILKRLKCSTPISVNTLKTLIKSRVLGWIWYVLGRQLGSCLAQAPTQSVIYPPTFQSLISKMHLLHQGPGRQGSRKSHHTFNILTDADTWEALWHWTPWWEEAMRSLLSTPPTQPLFSLRITAHSRWASLSGTTHFPVLSQLQNKISFLYPSIKNSSLYAW